jgi:large subunit ribosomal protein L31
MKANIHPKYGPVLIKCMGCGTVIETRSTKGRDFSVDVCSNCHPFYTGRQKFVDSAGRIERFEKKWSKVQVKPKPKPKAPPPPAKPEVSKAAPQAKPQTSNASPPAKPKAEKPKAETSAPEQAKAQVETKSAAPAKEPEKPAAQ